MKSVLTIASALLSLSLCGQTLDSLYRKADGITGKYQAGYLHSIREIEALDSAQCIWYSTQTEDGIKYFVVDPEKKKITPTDKDLRKKRPRGGGGHWSNVWKEDGKNPVVSPDSTREAYISEGNLWIRDLKTKEKNNSVSTGHLMSIILPRFTGRPIPKKLCVVNTVLRRPANCF